MANAPYGLLSAQTFFGLGIGRRDCNGDGERDGFECWIVTSVFVVALIIDFGGFFFRRYVGTSSGRTEGMDGQVALQGL